MLVRSIGLLTLIVAVSARGVETELVAGINPDWSPDGRKIAFQALRNGTFSVGTVVCDTRRIEWIEDGPGQAAYPAWLPNGAIVYTYGHDTNTAFSAKRSQVQDGYGIRVSENGRKRNLSQGRFRDYTPLPTADGRSLYFTTTRWATSYPGAYDMASDIARLDLVTGEIVRVIPSPGDNAGVVQAAVSPDGRYLVWGKLDTYTRWSSWCLAAARIDRLDRVCELTPPKVTGIAPRWSSDGRWIAFTGFVAGDPGWSVYVMDPRTGGYRRLCRGENPCFSPDGKRIAFDRDRKIYIRDFAENDFPKAGSEGNRPFESETVVWRMSSTGAAIARHEVPSKDFAFGDKRAFFVRMRGTWDGCDGLLQPVIGEYEEHEHGFQLFFSGGKLYFSTRTRDNRYIDIQALPKTSGVAVVVPGKPFEVTACRFSDRLSISINGNEPTVQTFDGAGCMRLMNMRALEIGRGCAGHLTLDSVEIGTGWPETLPKPATREEVFE